MGLWPVVLGVLCLPVALASVIRLVDDPRGPLRLPAAAGHLAIIAGTALAHPSILFSLAVPGGVLLLVRGIGRVVRDDLPRRGIDRKSTRLNSSHVAISYAVFCLKQKKKRTLLYTH